MIPEKPICQIVHEQYEKESKELIEKMRIEKELKKIAKFRKKKKKKAKKKPQTVAPEHIEIKREYKGMIGSYLVKIIFNALEFDESYFSCNVAVKSNPEKISNFKNKYNEFMKHTLKDLIKQDLLGL